MSHSRSATDILTLNRPLIKISMAAKQQNCTGGETITGYPRTRVCEPTFPPDADRGTSVLYEPTDDSLAESGLSQALLFPVSGFQQDVVLLSQHTKVIV